MKISSKIFVFLCSVLIARVIFAGELQHEIMTVNDQSGRSIELTMVYTKNDDGSKTVVRLEPQEKVKAFFDQACKEEEGQNSRFVEPDGNLRFSGTASFSYTCQTE